MEMPEQVVATLDAIAAEPNARMSVGLRHTPREGWRVAGAPAAVEGVPLSELEEHAAAIGAALRAALDEGALEAAHRNRLVAQEAR